MAGPCGGLRIVVDDLAGPQIARFLADHVAQMRAITPPESVHALDLDGLRRPEVTFWSMLDGDAVVACGAIKTLDPDHAEVKSMRTAPERQRQGLASAMLRHLIGQASDRGFSRLSLETGSSTFFAPARALYLRHGFTFCGPFGTYRDDPHSVFMTRCLTHQAQAAHARRGCAG
jgi:putative acetyltransferase